jgi:hypothetical protein
MPNLMIIHETKMGIESTSNWLKAAGDYRVDTDAAASGAART